MPFTSCRIYKVRGLGYKVRGLGETQERSKTSSPAPVEGPVLIHRFEVVIECMQDLFVVDISMTINYPTFKISFSSLVFRRWYQVSDEV